MNEDVFFKSTPRKIIALWEIHSKFNGLEVKETSNKQSTERKFIDEIPFL